MIGPIRLKWGRKPVDQISALSSMSNVGRRFKQKGVTVTLFRARVDSAPHVGVGQPLPAVLQKKASPHAKAEMNSGRWTDANKPLDD
jgi:hypothetical protein